MRLPTRRLFNGTAMHKIESQKKKWISQIVALQKKMDDHLVYDEHADHEKHARDWLDQKRDQDRIALMRRLLPVTLEDCEILEIGSGVGTFNLTASQQNLNIQGVEPVAELVALSEERLAEAGITADIRVGSGEKLPYPDNSFDLVVSFQVLEHVDDPAKTIYEALRVLRPEGYIFFNIPSYHSFWEGHYGIFWWPNLHKYPALMRFYIRLMKRDPYYTNLLNFITPELLRNIVQQSPIKARIHDLGYDVWRERLYKQSDIPAWGYTKKLLKVVAIARRLGLIRVLETLGKRFEFYTPIVFVCQRKCP